MLDSSALVAYFQGEKGRNAVKAVFQEARRRTAGVCMSTLNLSEVVYAIARARGDVKPFLEWLPQLPVTFVPPDQQDAVAAAMLKVQHVLSYGDCFAAALAHRQSAELMTRDPDFEKVKDLVKIVWISPPFGPTD